MATKSKFQRTLVIIKPDALQRSLVGEIIHRFERKGLLITGMKMMALDDAIVMAHYFKYKDKPFFGEIAEYMKSFPVVCVVIEGMEAIAAVRKLVGTRIGHEAEAGSIRGDFAVSGHKNIIHASDSPENAEEEIKNFFKKDEIFDYDHLLLSQVYGPEDLE